MSSFQGLFTISRVPMPVPQQRQIFYIDLYLSPTTGQNNSVSSSFSNRFFMIMICECSSVTFKAYIHMRIRTHMYIYSFFISFRMNIGELLTNTSMFI